MAQTAIPASLRGTLEPSDRINDRARWRWAGGFGLAHIVLMLVAFSLEGVAAVEHGTPATKVAQTYGGVGIEHVFLTSYVESTAFIMLVPALVLMARLFARRTETGHVAAQSFLGLGIACVAATLAIGFPPLTTAVYAAHHGIDAGTVSTINDLRNNGFLLQVALMAAFTLALGIAAVAERAFTTWGAVGIGVGALGLVAVPFVHNAVSMVWMSWWVVLSVLCLRGGPRYAAKNA